MIAVRAALLAALLGLSPPAFAQSSEQAGVPPALLRAVAAYRAGDLDAAEAAFRRLAPANADAVAWLGAVLIDRGHVQEGLASLQRALAAGSPEAAQQLGVIYAQGAAGVARDDARAARLFERAARVGHRRAEFNLGILYLRGQGVPRDLVEARAWLQKAAAGDAPYALYALARAMEESAGATPADPAHAAALYRRAAEKGHALAALRYGLALADGKGVKQDMTGAQRWLLAAQKDGVPEAALALGDLTVRSLSRNDKAADRKILQDAVAWYALAANAGVASAQFKLANAYYTGAGVARDVRQAEFWYGRAAHQGLADAQNVLGVLLVGRSGDVPVDPVEGYKWLLLAERGGNPEAKAVREKVADQLSESDRTRAEALAAAFTPVPERNDPLGPPAGTSARPRPENTRQ
jgi:TPR repeat protein